MERPTSSYKHRESPSEHSKSPNQQDRLRSACDSCHQAKVKCSGESPCSTCHVSQLRCVYSPISRQGRPKGSKNKRTLVQESKSKSIEGRNQGSKALNRQQQQQQQQQAPPSAAFDLDLNPPFDTTSTTDQYLPDDPDLLLSPTMSSFLDSTSTDPYLEHDINSSFAELSSRLNATPMDKDANSFIAHPYAASRAGTVDSSNYNSETATGTSSPFARESGPSDPRGSIMTDSRSRVSSIAKPMLQPCSCLQQQAQLVYKLDDLEKSPAKPSDIDAVLRGVQLARSPWDNLMQCYQCQSETDQKETYLLFAMSIRTLLSLLQNANAYDTGVFVGSYELSGKAKSDVISLLFRDALQCVTSALLHLQERTGRPRRLPNMGGASNGSPWGSSNGMLLSPQSDTQLSLRASMYSDTENLGSLLDTLQCTMQAMKDDLKVAV